MLATGYVSRLRYLVRAPLPIYFEDNVVDTIARVRWHTMSSSARIAALIDAVEYVVRARIPGALVECGVWRGGSMMAAALTLRRLGEEARDLYLFDTFTGMTAPTEEDANSAYDGYSLTRMFRRRKNWSGVPVAPVRAAMETTGYPIERVHLVAGPVEETLPGNAPDLIALLRLDTDWYVSTRA